MPSSDDFAIAAWFQLADADGFNFTNTLKRDVVIRTTDDSQRILIGPTPAENAKPSLLSISHSNLTICGDLFIEDTGFVGRISQNDPLSVNGVSFSNESLRAKNIVVNDIAKFRNTLNAAHIQVNGKTVFDENGKLQNSSIVDHSITDTKIARNTITNDAIYPQTIKSDSLDQYSITENKISPESITYEKIRNNTITSEKYGQYSIHNKAIDDEIVDSRILKDNAVTTSKLKDRSVTSNKISKNIELNGHAHIHGALSINTLGGFTDDLDIIPDIPKKDEDSSLDIFKKMSFIGEDKTRSFFYQKNSNIALNHEDPNYTFDVNGSINCSSGLFQNGKSLLFSQWYSTPNPYDNCNLVYMDGFVGINEYTPSCQLHVGGDIKTNSGILFGIDGEIPFIRNKSSNLGINESQPSSTLDIGGNLAIKNTEILDESRNLHNILHTNVDSLKIKNERKNKIAFDVSEGDVKFNVRSLLINPYYMIISSKGNVEDDKEYYYNIAHIYASNDERENFGALNIEGILGESIYKRNCHFHTIISNRGFSSQNDLSNTSSTRILGGEPNEVTKYTDLELYELNQRELFVFLKTTPKSMFQFSLQSGNLLKNMNEKWYETKSADKPSIQNARLQKVKSLINNDQSSILEYNGKNIFKKDVEVGNDLNVKMSLCNDGNIVTKGQGFHAFSDNMERTMFDIQRDYNKPEINISANVYKKNDDSWYLQDGEKGCLQMKMINATHHNTGSFQFKGMNTIYNEDNVATNLKNWVTFHENGVGINDVPEPETSLHIRGDTLIDEGTLKINCEKSFLQAFNKDLLNGQNISMIWGKNESPDSHGTLKYVYDRNKGNYISMGFEDKEVLNVVDNKKIGINTNNPNTDLHVKGNIHLENGTETLSKFDGKSLSIKGFGKQYSASTTWDKIALLKNESSNNRGVIYLNGTVSYKEDDFFFHAYFHFDANNFDNCNQTVTIYKNNENFFKTIFDIVLIPDKAGNVHLYAKCDASNINVNLDIKIMQFLGQGIVLYENKTFENGTYSDDNDFDGIRAFIISIRDNAHMYIYNNNGNFSIGDLSSENKLDVAGKVGVNEIQLHNGIINTKNENNFVVNGTTIVDYQGNIVTANIPNESLEIEKISKQGLQDLWTNINTQIQDRNIHLYNDRIGIFREQPDEPYTTEISSTLILSSNIDENNTNKYGKVYLTTSLKNGLGVNVSSPQYTLDIGGDINLSGILMKNGKPLPISPFTSYDQLVYTPSHVAIGKGFENKFNNNVRLNESLCIYNDLSLSNLNSKTILTTQNNRLGINESDPNSTLDVNGGISIKNVEIVDQDRNLVNIESFHTPVIHASHDKVGIGKKNPQCVLDVHGDINFDGDLLQNGKAAISFSNQWKGGNTGLTYSANVGIKTDEIPKETLCIQENLSLSNDNGKVVQYISDNGQYLFCQSPHYSHGIGLSNNMGFSKISVYQNKIGLGYTSFDQSLNTTLDINGNLGIKGTEIIKDDFSLSNISEIYSDYLTVKNNHVGINTRDPIHSLTINGDIGFHNENTVLSVIDNYLNIIGNGLISSNVIINSNKNEKGLIVNTQNDISQNLPLQDDSVKHDEFAPLSIEGSQACARIYSKKENSASYLSFYDAHNNFGFLGLEGNGLYDEKMKNEKGTLSLISKNDLRFMTNHEESLRIKKDGKIGIHTAYPMYSLDIAGDGIGIVGEHFVDNERNVFAHDVHVESLMETRNLKPNVISPHSFEKLNLRLTSSDGGIRTTDKNSGDFASFSNILNTNEKGSIVMMEGSNLYFNATDNSGASSFMNIAYQPIQPNKPIKGNESINVDTYHWTKDKEIHMIGNTNIIGNNAEIINPMGHKGITSFRLRNWNPLKMDTSASNFHSSYFEMQIQNDKNEDESLKLVSCLQSDNDIEFKVNEQNLMVLSNNKETESHVFIPESSSLGLFSLSTGGVKQVYADQNGNLTANSSDIRMKMNIESSTYGMKDICKIQPVCYQWNSSFINPLSGKKLDLSKERGKQKEIGLIAQDVQKIVPECVGQNVDSTLFIDYGKLVPVLIKSVQELVDENKKIKKVLLEHFQIKI